jgi:hypothetical protein
MPPPIQTTLQSNKWADDTVWRAALDPRVAAVVAAVPMASPIEAASLAPPRVPLGLVRTGLDRWLAPRHHIDRVRSACAGSTLPDGQPGCTLLADMPHGGHGSMLSPPPVGLPPRTTRLLDDPAGFDRADALPAVYDAVAAFSQIQLATPPPAPATPS